MSLLWYVAGLAVFAAASGVFYLMKPTQMKAGTVNWLRHIFTVSSFTAVLGFSVVHSGMADASGPTKKQVGTDADEVQFCSDELDIDTEDDQELLLWLRKKVALQECGTLVWGFLDYDSIWYFPRGGVTYAPAHVRLGEVTYFWDRSGKKRKRCAKVDLRYTSVECLSVSGDHLVRPDQCYEK